MAFHVVFPFAFQWMRIKFFWYRFVILQHFHNRHQCFNLFYIITKTFEVFFELRSFTDFFHDYSIDFMKLSKLSVATTPASSPFSTSFIAANVTALGISSNDISFVEALSLLNTFTPLIDFNTAFRCAKIEGFSTCNVNVAINSSISFETKILQFIQPNK